MKANVISIFLSCLLILSINQAQAQFNSGNLIIGGTLSFENNTATTTSTNADGLTLSLPGNTVSRTELTPRIGLMISEKWMAGGRFGINSTIITVPNNEQNTELKQTTNIFLVGPFARYYAAPLGKVGLFVEGNVNLGFGNRKTEVTSSQNNSTVSIASKVFEIDAGLTPGVNFMITPNIALEGTFGRIGYNSRTIKEQETTNPEKETNSKINVSLNPGSFAFGMILFF